MPIGFLNRGNRRSSLPSILFFFMLIKSLPALGDTPCGDRTLTIGWHDFPPFSYRNQQTDRLEGFDIETISHVLDAIGCDYRFVEMTWARTLASVSDGTIDIGMFAYRTAEREKFYEFSVPYRRESQNIAVKIEDAESVSIETLDDVFSGAYTVTADLHTWFGEEFSQRLRSLDTDHFLFHTSGQEKRIRMLLADRATIAIGNKETFDVHVSEMNVEGRITVLPFEVYGNDVHYFYNRDNTSTLLRQRIDEYLQAFVYARQDSNMELSLK